MLLTSLACVCATSSSFFFFFNDTATTEIYTLSLHDALPIWVSVSANPLRCQVERDECILDWAGTESRSDGISTLRRAGSKRSGEHTSELPSPQHLLCRPLLLKKKKKTPHHTKSATRSSPS